MEFFFFFVTNNRRVFLFLFHDYYWQFRFIFLIHFFCSFAMCNVKYHKQNWLDRLDCSELTLSFFDGPFRLQQQETIRTKLTRKKRKKKGAQMYGTDANSFIFIHHFWTHLHLAAVRTVPSSVFILEKQQSSFWNFFESSYRYCFSKMAHENEVANKSSESN